MQEQQYILRRTVGTALSYSHAGCMRAGISYTKVPLAKILTCDAPCDVCGEPLLQVPMRDCLVHTDVRPFCGDITCPCYQDRERHWRYVSELVLSGKITEDEAVRIFSGQPAQ